MHRCVITCATILLVGLHARLASSEAQASEEGSKEKVDRSRKTKKISEDGKMHVKSREAQSGEENTARRHAQHIRKEAKEDPEIEVDDETEVPEEVPRRHGHHHHGGKWHVSSTDASSLKSSGGHRNDDARLHRHHHHKHQAGSHDSRLIELSSKGSRTPRHRTYDEMEHSEDDELQQMEEETRNGHHHRHHRHNPKRRHKSKHASRLGAKSLLQRAASKRAKAKAKGASKAHAKSGNNDGEGEINTEEKTEDTSTNEGKQGNDNQAANLAQNSGKQLVLGMNFNMGER